MSVGEATIDAQHKRLLGQLNKVIDAMGHGSASEEVAEALKFFEEYINEHLAYEEEYMRVRGFSQIEHHKTLHQSFRDQFANFLKRLESGTTPDTVLVEMEGFLGNWWIGHIGHEDHKYFEELGAAEQK